MVVNDWYNCIESFLKSETIAWCQIMNVPIIPFQDSFGVSGLKWDIRLISMCATFPPKIILCNKDSLVVLEITFIMFLLFSCVWNILHCHRFYHIGISQNLGNRKKMRKEYPNDNCAWTTSLHSFPWRNTDKEDWKWMGERRKVRNAIHWRIGREINNKKNFSTKWSFNKDWLCDIFSLYLLQCWNYVSLYIYVITNTSGFSWR